LFAAQDDPMCSHFTFNIFLTARPKQKNHAGRNGHAAANKGFRIAPIPLYPVEAAQCPVPAVSATVEEDEGIVESDAEGLVYEVRF